MQGESIPSPSEFDVICGTTREASEYKGSRIFVDFVSNNVEKYDKATEKDQKKVARRTIEAFQHVTGGRFLKCNQDGRWYVIDKKEAVQKTLQMFKNSKRITPPSAGVSSAAMYKPTTQPSAEEPPEPDLEAKTAPNVPATITVQDHHPESQKAELTKEEYREWCLAQMPDFSKMTEEEGYRYLNQLKAMNPIVRDGSTIASQMSLASMHAGNAVLPGSGAGGEKVLPSSQPTDPTPTDVLCGGRGIQAHKGNRLFQTFIRINLEKYNGASSHDKKKVVEGVVDSFRQVNKSRFLRMKEDGCWYEIGDGAAAQTTAQAFTDVEQI